MVLTAPLLLDIGLVLLLAAGAGWVARRLHLPAVIGYLLVGLAVSPFTPGYVADRAQLQLLADLGVVLLLFEVGIEVDVYRIRREQWVLLVVAPLQVLLTAAAAGLVLLALGVSMFGAALVGLAVSLSSSVVIVNITRSRWRTTDPPTERALLGWSVLQDLFGIALALVILAIGG
ncbi:MAG: sodium:proton antiporter, partial [Chloroflexi bacterium]|nr:sodium:proton antiporter [Chloroflexota bacterium]